MALTPSTMLELGTPAHDFALPDTEGHIRRLAEFGGNKALVVMFICNHCPYVKHVAPQLKQLAEDYADQSVAFVAISSNDVENYPDDSPEKMKEEKEKQGWPFPYLYDESQEVALQYTAACTPDFFVFDHDRKLTYRGQLDDTRPNRISSGNYDSSDNPSDGKDLRAAIDAVLNDEPPRPDQRPSTGCNIKWKRGNEPAVE